VYGVAPYVDPKFFEDNSYILTEKSDIYSLGMIFWKCSVTSTNIKFVELYKGIKLLLFYYKIFLLRSNLNLFK